MLAEDHEHPGQYALWYLKTLAAWEYAISYTTRLKIFHTDMVPRLFIVGTPCPPKYDSGFNLRPGRGAQATLGHRQLMRLLLTRLWRNLLHTSIGTSSHLGAPFIAMTLHELNCITGMAKKCCFCCHELARRLALAIDNTEMKFKFTVPGTSGTVFPWSPPLLGIPQQVLQELYSTLMTKFSVKLQRYIVGTAKLIQSSHSPSDHRIPIIAELLCDP